MNSYTKPKASVPIATTDKQQAAQNNHRQIKSLKTHLWDFALDVDKHLPWLRGNQLVDFVQKQTDLKSTNLKLPEKVA